MNEYEELAEVLWLQRQFSGANIKRPIKNYFDAESVAMDHSKGRDEDYIARVADALLRIAQEAEHIKRERAL